MYFDSRPVPDLRNLSFNGQLIEWVEEYKYLGLTLTSKMSYSIHINNVVSRVSHFIGTFYCLRVVVPRFVLTMLYSSFVMPHILLHIEIWGAAPAVHMSRLNVKINMLLRSIMGARYIGGRPTLDTSMYNQLGMLKLKNVFKLRLYSLLVSLLNGSLPDFFNLFLATYSTTHNYATRGRIFRTPLVSCEVERRAVSYQLIRLYEVIPAQYCNIDDSSHGRISKTF